MVVHMGLKRLVALLLVLVMVGVQWIQHWL